MRNDTSPWMLTRRSVLKSTVAVGAVTLMYRFITHTSKAEAANMAAQDISPQIIPVSLKINGKIEQLSVDIRTTLLDTLRDHLRFNRVEKRL